MVVFKVGDAFANKLFTPFMIDLGFSKTEIAIFVKPLFTASAVGGSVLGGLLMVRLGLLRSMLIFGVLAGPQQPALLRAGDRGQELSRS